MDICCDGVVIRETAYGDNDKIVTLLTDTLGKITVTAKGVRSIKSKNSAAVQLFALSQFELTGKNGRYTLKTALLNNSFYALRDDINRFALGSYIVDVVGTVCTENSDETQMLRLLKNCLYAMAEFRDVPLWKIKAAFELKCMAINGLAPDLSCCCDCGKSTEDDTFADKFGYLLFAPSEGAPMCAACAAAREQNYFVQISRETAKIMQYLLECPQSKMLRFSAEQAQVKNELCTAAEKYLCCQTMRRYETLAFYKSLDVM